MCMTRFEVLKVFNFQLNYLLFQPFAIGTRHGDLCLELNVLDEGLQLGVDEQHSSGLQATLQIKEWMENLVKVVRVGISLHA
jgi:hypothetical protein